MKYFDEAQLLHEKAGYGGWILHGTAGSWLGAVLGGPVRALGGRTGQVEERAFVRREDVTHT